MFATPTTHDQAVFAVSVAIMLGATLMGARHTVGRYHLAVDSEESLRFACLDRRASVMSSIEIEKHATSLYTSETTERQDWSAFGAASAFVLAEGVGGTRMALRKAGLLGPARAKRAPKNPLEVPARLGQRVIFDGGKG